MKIVILYLCIFNLVYCENITYKNAACGEPAFSLSNRYPECHIDKSAYAYSYFREQCLPYFFDPDCKLKRSANFFYYKTECETMCKE